MSFYRNQLEAWLKTFNIKADRVLDLGGAANPIRSRVKSFEAKEYVCFDSGAEESKTDYFKFDINLPLEQLTGYNEGSFKFDCLFCLEVFEYVWNPVEAFRNVSRLLCDDGVAYISFPAIYPVHNPTEIDFLRYTKRAIEKYCELNKFEIIELIPRVATAREELSSFYSKEGMHPVRGSDLPFDIGYLLKIRKPYQIPF
jgi:SAM-dependent methyltransferase